MKKAVYYLALVAASLLVFYQTLGFHFLEQWDDGWQVLNRFTTNGLTPRNLEEIFSTFYYGQYSPVNQLFYTLIYKLDGLHAKSYHLANVVWHTGYVCLVFLFFDRLLKLHAAQASRRNTLVAFIVALLLAIHPVQVETVAWISASKVLTCSFFLMASLVSYTGYLQSGRIRSYVASILWFTLAFFCKEQAVVLPVCLLLVDWFARRNWKDASVLVEKVPFFLLAVCFVEVTTFSYDQTLSEVVVSDEHFYTFPQRIAFTGFSLVEYLQKIFLPVNLMYIYPYPMEVGDSLPLRFWIYPLVIPALAFAVWYFRKDKVFVFGSLFFLIQLSLFLHVIPLPRFTITANRYLYVAASGVFLIVAWHVYPWIAHARPGRKAALCLLSALLLSGQGFYSYRLCKEWDNDRVLKSGIKSILKERDTDQYTYKQFNY